MQQNKIVCRCIERKRDNNNNTVEFVLQDNRGNKRAVSKDALKLAMTNGEVEVINLQIDGGGRLVDKAIPNKKHSERPSTPSRPIQDMTNKELFEYMKGIDDAEKLSNEQLLKIIKEIYKRCVNTDDKFNHLMSTAIPEMLSQIHQLQDTIQNQEAPSLQSQMESIQSYLLQNADKMEEIKNGMTELSDKLQSLSEQQTEDNTKHLVTASGEFSFPEDAYGLRVYSSYFKDFDPQSIFIEDDALLELLKEEIAKTSKAYLDTESYYMDQLNEHSELYNYSSVLAEIMAVLAKNREDKGFPPLEVMKEATASCVYGIGGLFSSKLKQKEFEKDFGSSTKIDKEKKIKLIKEVDGIWNNAIAILQNNPYWEVTLYVIQTLNKLYLNTFKISNGMDWVMKNQNGNMDARVDSSLTDKHANSLTELSLYEMYNLLEEMLAVKIKKNECRKEVYDRFIVAYFASKKILYRTNKSPFSDTANSEINGFQVKLMEQALILMNVIPEIAAREIDIFIYNNNKRGPYQYQIDDTVNLSTLSI